MALVLACFFLVWLLVPSRPASAADWPTARGNPQRTGSIDDQPGPKAPKVLWAYKAQEDYVTSPVPSDQALILSGLGAFNTGIVRAFVLDPKAPERLAWSKNTPYLKRPVVSAPVISKGLAIFGDGMHQTDDAQLYCLRAEDGLPVWELPVPGKLVHLESSPTVLGDKLYVCGGDAGVLCVDLGRMSLDGKERSMQDALAQIAQRWAELQEKYQKEKEKDPQFALPPTEESLPKRAAKLVWQQGQGKWHIDAPPAAVHDAVLVASSYLDDEKVGKRCLLRLKARDGAVAWETPLELNPWGGPTLAGDVVLVGCSSIRFDRKLIDRAQGEIVAADFATGKLRWRHSAGGILSPVAVRGNIAVYTSTDGKIVARNVQTGAQLWEYAGGKPFFAGPAIAVGVVYAVDLKSMVHAVSLADGKPLWKLDLAADAAIQSRSLVFGSPIVHGGDLYLATCNLDGESEQVCYVACLSDRPPLNAPIATKLVVDRASRTVSVPARIAPRKLGTLAEVYPLEVVATFPSPRGQKAHETIVNFECKPSEVHAALVSLGLKPGKPARGDGVGTGPELEVLLEYTGLTGKPRLVPVEKIVYDTKTGKPLPPIRWHFTGSVARQIDPEKDEKVYGADLSGTLVSFYPVTDETVLQSNLSMRECGLLALECNLHLVPEEGTEVRLVIRVK